MGRGGTCDPALFIPPHPSSKGPRLCNPANPLLSTHIARGWVVRAGVNVRAGRQQDLRHLRMPTDRRHVKWSDLVLRGDRSGKEDMDKEKNEREKGYMCWSRDTDIYYNITLEARATIQHANTQGLCACLGGGTCRGHSRENRLLETATQLPFWCFYAPMAP